VAMDEVVLEIETDKTALPVMSPGNGTVVKLLVKEGEAVKSQQPLFQVYTCSLLYQFIWGQHHTCSSIPFMTADVA
jgi:hypothetical protein